MIKNILFDLDGTLLPMDQDKFVQSYFSKLVKKLAPLGYDPDKTVKAIWSGVSAMVKNTGEVANEKRFWEKFTEIFGDDALKDKPVFDDFYKNDFPKVQADCGFNPNVADIIKFLKESGYRLVLATNPLFPSVATESRIGWAGLDKKDFEFYTTYENSHYCKPNPLYYKEIIDKLDMNPDECLMVGNDTEEDVAATKLGINVFLLTDSLLNKNNINISTYPNGGFTELLEYIKKLPKD